MIKTPEAYTVLNKERTKFSANLEKLTLIQKLCWVFAEHLKSQNMTNIRSPIFLDSKEE